MNIVDGAMEGNGCVLGTPVSTAEGVAVFGEDVEAVGSELSGKEGLPVGSSVGSNDGVLVGEAVDQ